MESIAVCAKQRARKDCNGRLYEATNRDSRGKGKFPKLIQSQTIEARLMKRISKHKKMYEEMELQINKEFKRIDLEVC